MYYVDIYIFNIVVAFKFYTFLFQYTSTMANNYPFPLLEVNELVQNFRQELPELTLTQTDFSTPKVC